MIGVLLQLKIWKKIILRGNKSLFVFNFFKEINYMEYGIFFKRPKTKKRGFNLPDDYINIEVHTWSEKNESSENPEEILLKLNHYWNTSEKLF